MMFQYIRGMAPGIPAMMLTAQLNGVVQLDGGKKRVLAAAYVVCGTNLAGETARAPVESIQQRSRIKIPECRR